MHESSSMEDSPRAAVRYPGTATRENGDGGGRRASWRPKIAEIISDHICGKGVGGADRYVTQLEIKVITRSNEW